METSADTREFVDFLHSKREQPPRDLSAGGRRLHVLVTARLLAEQPPRHPVPDQVRWQLDPDKERGPAGPER